jgi:type I restriction enzyme S subunit
MYALRSHVAQEQFLRREVGVAVTGINIGDLKQVRLPVPSLDQQEIIASVLDERSEGHNRLVACHEKQVQLLKDHHRALITAAVTGQFDIPGVAA